MVVRFDLPSLSADFVGDEGSGGGGGGGGGASMFIPVELAERKRGAVRCRRGRRQLQTRSIAEGSAPSVRIPRSPSRCVERALAPCEASAPRTLL